jgi:hypothetical protein
MLLTPVYVHKNYTGKGNRLEMHNTDMNRQRICDAQHCLGAINIDMNECEASIYIRTILHVLAYASQRPSLLVCVHCRGGGTGTASTAIAVPKLKQVELSRTKTGAEIANTVSKMTCLSMIQR